MACAMLAGCGAKEEAESAASDSSADAAVVDDAKLLEFPAECKLTDDQLNIVVTSYGDYMTEALKSEGYTVTARTESDGSIHYDGTRPSSDGTTETVPDLRVFDSAKDCYAYLYNCGQVDIDGNLLVSISTGLEEAVDEAASDAESEATAELDGEPKEAADGEEVPSDSAETEVAEEDAAAESEAPVEEAPETEAVAQ